MSDRIILKKCDENDVSSLSKIGVSTFEETFAAVNSKENMEAYL